MDIKFLKMFLIIINKHWYYWCPHTDSNREPTDYKSASPNLSSLIILDSKGYWSLRSRTLFHGRQADDKSKTMHLVFDILFW